jgi:hypothetical protein
MQFEGLVSTTLNALVWKVWPLPIVNFVFGWLCKVGFGWWIDFKEGGGQIVAIVHFAIMYKRRRIYYTNIDLLQQFGRKFYHGVASKISLRYFEQKLRWMIGGQ